MRLPATASVLWLLRPLHWWQRRRHGGVLQPRALWSYRPRAMLAFLALFAAVRRRDAPVPLALRTLVALRVSQMNACAFCVDLNAAMLEAAGVPLDRAFALPHWRDDPGSCRSSASHWSTPRR